MGMLKVPNSEIRFAAKTGFLSRTLWEEFFAEGAYSWKLRQWKSFSEREYFKMHPSPTAKDTLVLNAKNPDVVKLVGADISAPPYVSQLNHDEIVTRSVLILKRQGLATSFLTESELKALNVGRERVRSAADRIKYPDMILDVGSAAKNFSVALELELTRKDYKRYYNIIGNYSTRAYADKVLFIGSSEGIFESLRKAMRENSYSSFRQPIGFVSCAEWEKAPATAPIYFSNKVTSLLEMKAESEAHGSVMSPSFCDGEK